MIECTMNLITAMKGKSFLKIVFAQNFYYFYVLFLKILTIGSHLFIFHFISQIWEAP